ncbi:ABC transporter permease [Paenibacillus radicis (ex Gao et al. 2016)]|uniref:ABC transporter permease n=1 Tax=Paenibacillus radicis (ex Gao et al. 2016) TaxID=1737354 RepID=A0A917LYA1_9BACL|nr:ABC-2 family transporter protein [Paenibacillus radicis (ex Gao et al. 2016)]GGG65186.1 ABC transporter permease [Paenibacillus radicis (ex Gao et al. 2016)]
MLQAYWYITKMRMLTNLAYRFEVFTSVGTNLIIMLASVFLWQTAYGGGIGQVQSLSLQDLTTYTILSIILSSMFVCDVQDTIYYKIREGQIVTDFYRPIPLLACYLADDIGGSLSSLANKALPLIVFASLFFGIPWPSSFLNFLLFIPSCLLSYGILWLLSALVGLIAFWVMELGNMGMVKDSIVRVLSGSIVPLWFFPESVQTVSKFLPFQYTYQTPLGIYIGNVGTKEALAALAVQAVWIIILFLLLAAGWKRTKKKTLIQGG